MIYSKYLTGNYQGEPYSKEQAKLKGTYDDIYVFDMADFCRIVTARELHKDRNMGESIYDIMTQEGIYEMLEYSKTYTDIPMLVKTAYGPALLIPSIVPSTSLLVLSYISVGGENLYKYCKDNGASVRYSSELDTAGINADFEMPDAVSRYCERYLQRIENAFKNVASGKLLSGDITLLLEERIYALSYYAGCSVSILCEEPIIAYGEFDFSMFVAFVFALMLTARRFSNKKEMALTLENKSYGTAILVSMATQGNKVYDSDELRVINAIADKRRRFFEHMCDDFISHIRFSPVSKDWSYLEIKSPSAES